ncbi:MAG TPA: MFS transporter [Jatrophihabitans sp.]|nr:MFS transporter [Jatrophihabitans sp.]
MRQLTAPTSADTKPAPLSRRFVVVYLSMTGTDAFGSGLFKTLAVLFWARYAHFSLPTVGAGLTVGGLCAMVCLLPLGRLGDRLGHRRLIIGLNLVTGATIATFPLVRSVVLFFVVVAVAATVEASLGPLRRSYVGRQLDPAIRPHFNARNRATFNAGFGSGAAVAGLGLAAGSNSALVALVLGDAASFLLAALAMAMLPPDRAFQHLPGTIELRGALSHPGLLGAGALVGLLALSEEALEIGLPVWIAVSHRVPLVMISLALVANTILVVLFQVPLARRLQRLPTTRSCRLAGGLLIAGFALMAMTGLLPRPAAILVTVLFVLLLTGSEIIAAAIDWEVSYRKSRPGQEAASQAAFSLGTSGHRAVGGLLFARSLAGFGSSGWLIACAAPVLVLAATVHCRGRGLLD